MHAARSRIRIAPARRRALKTSTNSTPSAAVRLQAEVPIPPDRARTMRTYIATFGSATAAAIIGARLLKLPVIRSLPFPMVIVGAVALGLGVGWIEGYEAMKRKNAEYQHAIDAQLNARAHEFPRVGSSS